MPGLQSNSKSKWVKESLMFKKNISLPEFRIHELVPVNLGLQVTVLQSMAPQLKCASKSSGWTQKDSPKV